MRNVFWDFYWGFPWLVTGRSAAPTRGKLDLILTQALSLTLNHIVLLPKPKLLVGALIYQLNTKKYCMNVYDKVGISFHII